MRTHLRLSGALLGAALVFGACSSETTREDAINDLTSEGLDKAVAECVVDDVEAAGFTADEVAKSSDEPDIQAALQDAIAACLSGDDFADLLAGSDLSDADIRDQFVDGITQSGDFTTEQGECIFDGLLAEGFTVKDLFGFGVGEIAPGIEDALGNAAIDCTS